MKSNHKSKIGKAWVYLRGGYSVYFSFIVGVGNTMMIAYFVVLTGATCPPEDHGFLCSIRPLFPNFGIFVIATIVVGLPIMIWLGRFHFNKQLYRSEMEVTWQNNPYGKILFKVCSELLEEIKEQNKFNPEKTKRLSDLQTKIDFLVKGGSLNES